MIEQRAVQIDAGGGLFIRCACTASRPVYISPLISTTSPTLSARTCSSVSGGAQNDFAAGERKARTLGHFFDRARGIAIEPVGDRAAGSVEPDAEAAEGPAIVGDRDEEAGGQTVGGADLAADQRHFAAEAHGADAEAVGFVHDLAFEARQDRDAG